MFSKAFSIGASDPHLSIKETQTVNLAKLKHDVSLHLNKNVKKKNPAASDKRSEVVHESLKSALTSPHSEMDQFPVQLLYNR